MRLGLTFSDVLLVPKRSPLRSRTEADTRTRFTRNVFLNIPLVSSNMATVTEHKMAIAMARHGGLGIIHQFNTIEEQVQEVQTVKRSTSYVIEHPFCLEQDVSLSQALELMEERKVTSVLIVNAEQELLGIVTARDYAYEKNLDKKISELMTPRKKLITASNDISLESAKQLLQKHRIEKLPLLTERTISGLITSQDIKKLES